MHVKQFAENIIEFYKIKWRFLLLNQEKFRRLSRTLNRECFSEKI